MMEQNVVVGPFQCNCKLLVCEKTFEAVLVDPGDEAEKIFSLIEKTEKKLGNPITVKALLHTHAHLDHIGATRKVYQKLAAEIRLHADDEPLYHALKKQGNLFGLNYEDPHPVQRFLEDEEEIKVGDYTLKVIHTPGHSPGGVCFQTEGKVYTGDTLFQGSIGRTDLWGGDTDLLIKSIKSRLFTLEDDFEICPGHGDNSLIGIEKRTNPFLN